jgi:hypothetical protein
MKIYVLTLQFLMAMLLSSISVADQHMEELMSEGVDFDGTVVEASSQSLNMPLANKPKSNVKRPVKASSKKKVLANFGEPVNRHKPKGKPPIERWDYQEFSVYFESNFVIHSVVRSNKK